LDTKTIGHYIQQQDASKMETELTVYDFSLKIRTFNQWETG